MVKMKGSTILFITVAGFVLVLGLIFGMYYLREVWREVGGTFVNVTSDDFGNTSLAYNTTNSIYVDVDNFLSLGDFLIASLFFGIILASLLSAFLVRFNPIFMPIYVILTIVSVVVSVTLRDAYLSIAADFPWLSSFPYSTTILQFLPYIVAVVGGLIILMQYAFRGETI